MRQTMQMSKLYNSAGRRRALWEIRWKMLMEGVCMAMLQGNRKERKVGQEIYNRVAPGWVLCVELRY